MLTDVGQKVFHQVNSNVSRQKLAWHILLLKMINRKFPDLVDLATIEGSLNLVKDIRSLYINKDG